MNKDLFALQKKVENLNQLHDDIKTAYKIIYSLKKNQPPLFQKEQFNLILMLANTLEPILISSRKTISEDDLIHLDRFLLLFDIANMQDNPVYLSLFLETNLLNNRLEHILYPIEFKISNKKEQALLKLESYLEDH